MLTWSKYKKSGRSQTALALALSPSLSPSLCIRNRGHTKEINQGPNFYIVVCGRFYVEVFVANTLITQLNEVDPHSVSRFPCRKCYQS